MSLNTRVGGPSVNQRTNINRKRETSLRLMRFKELEQLLQYPFLLKRDSSRFNKDKWIRFKKGLIENP